MTVLEPPLPPAVVVHGRADAEAALAASHASGRGVTLLSAVGAAGFAGCGWWRALMRLAAGGAPPPPDILDCADASERALEALRVGQRLMVLWPDAPAWEAVAASLARAGARLVDRPPALDLAEPGAARRLSAWLETRR